MGAENLISRLAFCRPVHDGEWLARCPAHDDRSPSLSIKELPDGRVLVNCFAGCGALDVITAVGLEWQDLFPPDDNYSPQVAKRRQETVDELVVAIAVSDMDAGKKLSDDDKERAREALHRIDNNIPSPDPDNMERNCLAVSERESQRMAILMGDME